MGFTFSVNLFAERSAYEVTHALKMFYHQEGKLSIEIYQNLFCISNLNILESLEIFAFPNWIVVDIQSKPEWWIRKRQLEISKNLCCSGLFLFQYDGDYWGYELFKNGKVVDRFTSDACHDEYFSGLECKGNAKCLAECFPFIPKNVFAPYLVQLPDIETMSRDKFEQQTDVIPREGDEYKRWSEVSVLNFLSALGIKGGFTGKWGRFEFEAPLYAQIDSAEYTDNT